MAAAEAEEWAEAGEEDSSGKKAQLVFNRPFPLNNLIRLFNRVNNQAVLL